MNGTQEKQMSGFVRNAKARTGIKTKLTQKRLKEVLYYNTGTGVFTWLKSTCKHIKVGDVAGSINSQGYRLIQIDNERYKSSRLAWFYVEGYWPEHEVDHRNRIRDDDRWQNLRHVSKQCNMRNRGMFKNNSSGITGVSWHKQSKKWQVRIKVNKKYLHLGVFATKREAAQARFDAEKKYNFPNCITTSTAYNYLKTK